MVVFALDRQSLDITAWQGNMSRHLFHVQEYIHDSYNTLAKMEKTKFSSVWFVIQLSTYVTLGPLYVMFTFLARIINRGVLGFANDCHCSVWCRGLTTCLMYVGPFWFMWMQESIGGNWNRKIGHRRNIVYDMLLNSFFKHLHRQYL